MAYISEFTQDIQHVPVVDNAAVDALSRPPQLSRLAPADEPPFLNTKVLSTAQAVCSTTAALATDPHFQVVKRLLASGHVTYSYALLLQAWIAHLTPFLTLASFPHTSV